MEANTHWPQSYYLNSEFWYSIILDGGQWILTSSYFLNTYNICYSISSLNSIYKDIIDWEFLQSHLTPLFVYINAPQRLQTCNEHRNPQDNVCGVTNEVEWSFVWTWMWRLTLQPLNLWQGYKKSDIIIIKAGEL